VRVVVTGTHTGPGLHKKPVPTGKAVRFGGMCIVHVKDGKVEESWNNFDFLSMYEQLA
jgi:predicted ester cyclase